MDIGHEIRTIAVEPLVDPVPRERPDPAPSRMREPDCVPA
jgi:hypothetical protein